MSTFLALFGLCLVEAANKTEIESSSALPYQKRGSIDVGTFENTIFWWKHTTYLVENINCGYADHAGTWSIWYILLHRQIMQKYILLQVFGSLCSKTTRTLA